MATLYGDENDNTLDGTGSADTLYGLDGADILNGLGGNDYLDGGIGDDTMTGGLGNDLYIVRDVGDVVTENADEGIDTVYSNISYILGANVENLALFGTADIDGTGNSLNNSISGNGGDNTLSGGDGNDVLGGAAGDDILYGGNGRDYLYGDTGADTMQGGAGDDLYQVDDVGDVVYEVSGEGFDRVNSSISYTLTANVESLMLTGTSDINGTGNNLDNYIQGNSGNNGLSGGAGNDSISAGGGNDVLVGGTGADWMRGGTGDDTYYVDDVGDFLVEYVGEGTDTVYSSASYHKLGSNIENLILTGSGNIRGVGNDLDNQITGNSGDNFIDGGTGNDTMLGSTGDDLYVVDSLSDVVTEFAGEGIDTVYVKMVTVGIDYTMGAHIENLIFTNFGNLGHDAIGNELDNRITGTDGVNRLEGGDGNDILSGMGAQDTLIGGNGNDVLDGGDHIDVLNGGAGDDRLMGGAAQDTYVYDIVNFGNDIIWDSGVAGPGSDFDLVDLNIFNHSDVQAWLALDSNGDTFIDTLRLDFGNGNMISIIDYFDNTNADDDLCGAGTGYIEGLDFANVLATFAHAQAWAS